MLASVRRVDRSWALGFLALALFWSVDLGLLRAGVPDPLDDTWEYGVAARQMLEGHGFRTQVVHPPLWTLRDARGTVPVLIHGALLPALVAPALAAFGPRALDAIAWAGAACALLAALALARLAAQRFGTAIGWGAAATFTLSPLVLRAVHHDVSLLLGAWLLVEAVERASRDEAQPWRAGLFLGAAALTRPEMLLAAPFVALLAGRRGPVLLLVALSCAAPAWIHAARAVGTPFFNLSSYLLIGYWGAHPGLSPLRDFAIPPAAWPHVFRDNLAALPAKWRDFLPHAIKRALLAPSGPTGWLVPIGALAVAWRGGAATRGTEGASAGARRAASPHAALAAPRVANAVLLAVGAALAAIPVAIMTLTVYDERYLTPFLPGYALAAALGARALARRLPPWGRTTRVWVTLLVAAELLVEGPALRDAAREARAHAAWLERERAALARAAPGAPPVLFSDMPDFVAFALDRPTVWLTRAEYERLPERGAGRPPADRPERGAAGEAWFHDAAGVPATGVSAGRGPRARP